MNLAQLIGMLKPSERRHLEEMVRHQPLNEDDSDLITGSDGAAAAPLGAKAQSGNGVTFVKTNAGWRVDLEVPAVDVLRLVKEDAKSDVEKALKTLEVGKEHGILSESLNSNIDAPSGKLIFRKIDDDKFIDPTYLSNDKMAELIKTAKVINTISESRHRTHRLELSRGMEALKAGEKLGFKHDPESVEIADSIAAAIIEELPDAWDDLLKRSDLTANVVSALKTEGHYDLARRAEQVGYSINETRRRVRLLLRKLY
jgi:hypothetical protein